MFIHSLSQIKNVFVHLYRYKINNASKSVMWFLTDML